MVEWWCAELLGVEQGVGWSVAMWSWRCEVVVVAEYASLRTRRTVCCCWWLGHCLGGYASRGNWMTGRGRCVAMWGGRRGERRGERRSGFLGFLGMGWCWFQRRMCDGSRSAGE